MTLEEWLPREAKLFWTPADKYMECQVQEEYSLNKGKYKKHPFKHKHVYNWCIISKNGKRYAVGWNENPNRGWSFPVKLLK